MMWGLIFICAEECEQSMKFFDERLQMLQEQAQIQNQLDTLVRNKETQKEGTCCEIRS